jgi:hypothetical protein
MNESFSFMAANTQSNLPIAFGGRYKAHKSNATCFERADSAKRTRFIFREVRNRLPDFAVNLIDGCYWSDFVSANANPHIRAWLAIRGLAVAVSLAFVKLDKWLECLKVGAAFFGYTLRGHGDNLLERFRCGKARSGVQPLVRAILFSRGILPHKQVLVC